MPKRIDAVFSRQHRDHQNHAGDQERCTGRQGDTLAAFDPAARIRFNRGQSLDPQKIAGQLVAHEQEAARHQQRVGREGVAQKSGARPPVR